MFKLFQKKKIFCAWIWSILLLLTPTWIYANSKEAVVPFQEQLYAKSAVLMDGKSKRVLYGKAEEEFLANASTTKIMTCILALESKGLERKVEVSATAAKMPKVHLGMRQGEHYRLKDLLYSLMLESHNDSAVAIAEALAGSVEQFAVQMNAKAKEIGCTHTNFLTPNGLDQTKEKEMHGTTARDLARIMSYCVEDSAEHMQFRELMGTRTYAFSDVEQKRHFNCVNHNLLLDRMPGMIAGKTGFTAKAGYCYVGAVEREGRLFIVALLACGWPQHRDYKWKDTEELICYGSKNYEQIDLKDYQPKVLKEIWVNNAGSWRSDRREPIELALGQMKGQRQLLKQRGEKIQVQYQMKEEWMAPVQKGQQIGMVSYGIDEKIYAKNAVITQEAVQKNSVFWWIWHVFQQFL